MRQRRRGRGGQLQLGLAWYTREGWERLRELASDRDALDDTFEAWERGARAALCELECTGRAVRKVPIDVEALAAWCRAQHRALDAAARAEYVTHRLQQG
ncbi:MAG TPA: hypothetical protein VMU55_04580 [Solirubrobacteraceae bacterium]|nr:hypothetical protein [Solirubrobacteraceae bacterium]